jgi:signal transduction histidine kinase
LRDRNEALEEADRLKTAFVSNMSYELADASDLDRRFRRDARRRLCRYAAAGRRWNMWARSSTASSGLGALIDNVLDLTQSDMGSLLLAETEVDLATLSRQAVRRRGATWRRARGSSLPTRSTPSVGHCHRRHAAAQPGDRQPPRQQPALYRRGRRVLLRAEGDKDEARIIISDNGPGIAPVDQPKVFDRFHRTVDGRAEDAAAIGLGLPLAKQFVEAHGGSIELQSRLGEGTSVHHPSAADDRAAGGLSQAARG